MGVTTFGVARPELSELDSESELEDEEDDDESLDFEWVRILTNKDYIE